MFINRSASMFGNGDFDSVWRDLVDTVDEQRVCTLLVKSHFRKVHKLIIKDIGKYCGE